MNNLVGIVIAGLIAGATIYGLSVALLADRATAVIKGHGNRVLQVNLYSKSIKEPRSASRRVGARHPGR